MLATLRSHDVQPRSSYGVTLQGTLVSIQTEIRACAYHKSTVANEFLNLAPRHHVASDYTNCIALRLMKMHWSNTASHLPIESQHCLSKKI